MNPAAPGAFEDFVERGHEFIIKGLRIGVLYKEDDRSSKLLLMLSALIHMPHIIKMEHKALGIGGYVKAVYRWGPEGVIDMFPIIMYPHLSSMFGGSYTLYVRRTSREGLVTHYASSIGKYCVLERFLYSGLYEDYYYGAVAADLKYFTAYAIALDFRLCAGNIAMQSVLASLFGVPTSLLISV